MPTTEPSPQGKPSQLEKILARILANESAPLFELLEKRCKGKTGIQTRIANDVAVSQSTISRIFATHDGKPQVVAKIVSHLQISAEEIVAILEQSDSAEYVQAYCSMPRCATHFWHMVNSHAICQVGLVRVFKDIDYCCGLCDMSLVHQCACGSEINHDVSCERCRTAFFDDSLITPSGRTRTSVKLEEKCKTLQGISKRFENRRIQAGLEWLPRPRLPKEAPQYHESTSASGQRNA